MTGMKECLNVNWKVKFEGKDTYSSCDEFKKLTEDSVSNNIPMK